MTQNLIFSAAHAGSNSVQLDFVDPASLRPYPQNPHKHPALQIEQIRLSIRANDLVARPIVVDEENVIIDGEAVWRAAKLEGRPTVPIFRLFGLSASAKRKLRIGLNKHGQNGDWAPDELRLEIEGILADEINLDPGEIGMSVGAIDTLLADPDPEDDVVPATPAAVVSRLGDIWLCRHQGLEHRIGCGDCRDLAFLQRVIGDGLVDFCITDPPFNRAIVGGATTGRGKTRHAEFAMASGEMSAADYERFLEEALSAAAKVSRSGAVHDIFIDHQHLETLLAVGARIYTQRLNICVWNKSNAGLGGLYRNKHELIGVFKVGEEPYFNAVQLGKHGRNRTNVWDYPSVNTFGSARRRDLDLHPTVKPTALIADAILDVTQRGDVVLDGFLGSGTCLLACERTGRLCRGIEISPAFVDLALTRWSERTGVEPLLEATGQTFTETRTARLAK